MKSIIREYYQQLYVNKLKQLRLNEQIPRKTQMVKTDSLRSGKSKQIHNM